jgi:hypothetical protein
MSKWPQKTKVADGITIKYHANGGSVFAKGKVRDDAPDGYWEWFRKDGTKKRSGYFREGKLVGYGRPMTKRDKNIPQPTRNK